MNFSLDPAIGIYRLGFPYGYLRTERTSPKKSGTTIVISFTPEGTEKLLQAKALDEMVEKVTELSELIDAFVFPEGTDPKLFRTATLSENGEVSAETESGAEIKTYYLDIDSIAKTKTFKSKVLSSNEETALSSGVHTFEIDKNGTVQSLDIDVDRSVADSDSNRDVFIKIALAINEADSDLEAEVVETERKIYSTLSDNLYEEASYLKVSTRETGDSIDFILQDDNETIVNDLRLNQNIQAGSKASYVLNKVAVESDTNSVTADNGKLELELLDVTDDTVTIAVENGAAPVLNQITSLISSHNDYVNFLDKNDKQIDSSIKYGIERDLNEIKSELSQVGLSLNSSGTIDINNRFDKEFEDNTDFVRQTLTGTEGLFPVIYEGLEVVSTNDTSNYAADSSFNLGSVTFSFYF